MSDGGSHHQSAIDEATVPFGTEAVQRWPISARGPGLRRLTSMESQQEWSWSEKDSEETVVAPIPWTRPRRIDRSHIMGQRGSEQVRRSSLVQIAILIARPAGNPLLSILTSISHPFSFYVDLDLTLALTPASSPC